MGAVLSEQGRLLISGDACDRNRSTEEPRIALSIEFARLADLRQDRFGDVKQFEQFRIPRQRTEIHQHGSTRVARIGFVGATLGQIPEQPRVDRAECKRAVLGFHAGIWYVFQDPAELGSGKVGIDDEPGFFGDPVGLSRSLESIAVVGGASILPDNRVVDRKTGFTIPDHGRFALIGDPDRGDFRWA